jgi:uncharacterized repeat protein (TIGR03837 family)
MRLPRLWDLFCRVVDNHGDLGVCWRLAADLAGRGERVRLHVDDARALAWMAPRGAPGVAVGPFDAAGVAPGDVVVEAFGCDPPPDFVARMAARSPAPVWVNLEYLSAESYVERSHRLASPQRAGPGAGLAKWFFYPGFTPATGGLLREPGLDAAQAAFDATDFWQTLGMAPVPGERVVSLFCYQNPAIDALLATLAAQPTLLLTTPGHATQQVAAGLGPEGRLRALRSLALPALTQTDYDRLLWACDLNFVRGEDSFVRAQWAARPFVWQIYPQDDGAHVAKLEAFLARYTGAASAPLGVAITALFRHWNGLAPPPIWPDDAPWRRHARDWRAALAASPDLVTELLRFATEKG